jgi:hypothetical protein
LKQTILKSTVENYREDLRKVFGVILVQIVSS